jgi:1,4-alpha-glucan branching enzyme
MSRKTTCSGLLALPFGLTVAVILSCRAQNPAPPVPPLGATLNSAGATFRVWAPFVDSVAVKVNGAAPVPLSREPGRPQADDTVWIGKVGGAKVGDRYTYVIAANGASAEFADPRARQLTGAGAGAAGVLVDQTAAPSLTTEPTLGELVIYELHIGTFYIPAGKDPRTYTATFTDAIAKLDYLKDLGVNAVEVMPVHENARLDDHQPATYNWGYDAVHLFAVNSAYGTLDDFKRFIKECHDRKLAVLLDVVYNHLLRDKNLLNRFGGVSGPGFKDGIYFYGDQREETGFGPRPDYGRPQVRAYIDDNALMWLRDYGVDGLRWDSTVNIRAFNNGHDAIQEGGQLLRQANNDYRTTSPKQPRKISIAEDLQGRADLTAPTERGGFGFNSQWDDSLWGSIRKAVFAVNDGDRDVGAIKGALEKRIGDAFGRVNYSENHDKVGHPGDLADGQPQIRLPALIDQGNAESIYAKKRSTLAAALVLTAPGIPMLFQGQEMLETQAFDFKVASPVHWERVDKFKGIVALYRDLIALRRNIACKTGGLTAANINVFHADGQDKVLAYHRFGTGRAGDDVVVVVNLSNRDFHPVNIGFPRAGPRFTIRDSRTGTALTRWPTRGQKTDWASTAMWASGHIASSFCLRTESQACLGGLADVPWLLSTVRDEQRWPRIDRRGINTNRPTPDDGVDLVRRFTASAVSAQARIRSGGPDTPSQ